MQTQQMKIHLFYNPKPKIDLSKIIGKNPIDKLVKLVQELAKSVTKTSSQIQEPKTYDKAINNLVHGNG